MNNLCLIFTLSSPWEGYPRSPFILRIADEIKKFNGVVLCLESSVISFHTLFKYPIRVKNFIKGKYRFRKVYNNIYAFPPFTIEHILLSSKIKILSLINKWLISKQIKSAIKKINLSIGDTILVLQRPELFFLQEIKDIKASVYDCCDDYIVTHTKHGWKLKGNEDKEKLLAQRCSFIIASANRFYQRNLKYNDNTYFLENGYSYKVFNESFSPEKIKGIELSLIDNLKRPIIGYIGNIRDWIDFVLLEYLFTKRSDWTFLFVGRFWKEFGKKYTIFSKKYENVIVTGYIDYNFLPVYIRKFDVGIIPYKTGEFMDSVNPNKFFEYLGANVPVVSTNIGDLAARYNDVVKIAITPVEFLNHLDSIVCMKNNEKALLKGKISEAAKNCTWEKNAEFFVDLMKKHIYTTEQVSE